MTSAVERPFARAEERHPGVAERSGDGTAFASMQTPTLRLLSENKRINDTSALKGMRAFLRSKPSNFDEKMNDLC